MKISHILCTLAVALLAGGITLEPAPADAAYPCPNGFSQIVVKTGGTGAGYPASCLTTSCHLNLFVAKKTATGELCNPVTGCAPFSYTAFVYKVSEYAATPAGACPADVSAAAFKAP